MGQGQKPPAAGNPRSCLVSQFPGLVPILGPGIYCPKGVLRELGGLPSCLVLDRGRVRGVCRFEVPRFARLR